MNIVCCIIAFIAGGSAGVLLSCVILANRIAEEADKAYKEGKQYGMEIGLDRGRREVQNG